MPNSNGHDSRNTRSKLEVIDRRRHPSQTLPPEVRMSAGKALRERVPRTSHAKWSAPPNRPNPLEVLKESDQGRVPELLPIRYGRMRKSPFAFFRGAASIMAWDLSHTPATGLRVQACGDCHVSNFGGFGSPERELLFDINDFDETLPAPWEWDVKRLAASILLASRERGIRERHCGDAVGVAVQSYREHMREYARMPVIEVWYSHLDASVLVDSARGTAAKKRWKDIEDKARLDTAEHLLPKLTEVIKGQRRIAEHPPLIYHTSKSAKALIEIGDLFHRYRQTLPAEKRVVLDRYQMVDVARKVVGVGSVGTRCAVALMMASESDPLVLQFKEASASVLEPYAGKSQFSNHGERVVTGQRMLQSASDVFLGWTSDDHGHHYYFRQLHDMKMSVDLAELSKQDWFEYVAICGWTLARAHARTGDPASISGYLGKNDTFDAAITKFATAYADQAENDYLVLTKAIRAGKVHADSDAAD